MAYELNGPANDFGVYIIIPSVPNLQGESTNTFGDEQVGETILRFIDQPSLEESRSADYQPESILHGMESFHAYSGTGQRTFNISGKFFSKNLKQAEANNKIIHVIRSLVMPDTNRTGAPPTPVKLYAFGPKHIFGLPCLVSSYGFSFSPDIDYVRIPDKGISIPIVFNISIVLIEQHSIKELRQFNLVDFRRGAMVTQGF